MKYALVLVLLFLANNTLFALNAKEEAKGVIVRTFGKFPKNVEFKYNNKSSDAQSDCFSTHATNGRLIVEGNSTIALCYGFYDFITSNGYGICSWTGNRLDLPEKLPTTERKTSSSPFTNRLYMNVCTFGYTSPFWGWNEWQRELDWMALHGFNMPLAPIAGEAILARVWREMGLTDDEINVLFTGPAHLPWMRMGNMSGLDGAPTQEWHNSQIELQHRIIDRMTQLGMSPVYQGFAGFVPPAMQRLYPDTKLSEMKWSGFKNWMLSPLDPLFSKIGTDFIRAWEKEFGKGKYYLIDSFNEMDVPFGPKGSKERAETLKHYGKTIFNSMSAANPDAVWVMQGWMFGYQRHIWDPQSVEALLSGAPKDKMIILDLAVDFNKYIWRSEKSWNYLSGFFGKEWIYSTVPNFGGRSALIGDLEFYLNGHLDALTSPNKGQLTGFGTSPEGVESNEVLYELIAAAGWSDKKLDIKKQLHNYSSARYGVCPPEIDDFWANMLQSSYNECSNNARYRWQLRPYSHRMPTMNINDHYYTAIESFMSVADQMNDSELYKVDAIQYAALYLCTKADMLLEMANWADLYGDQKSVAECAKLVCELLANADRLLASHPILNLDRWLEMAQKAGCTPEEKKRFTEETYRLVSTWGGPSLSDYSSRVWSGVIRDFYIPRLQRYFDAKSTGKCSDFSQWDELWRTAQTKTEVSPFENPLSKACELVEKASSISNSSTLRPENAVAYWSPFEFTKATFNHNFTIRWDQFEKAKAIRIIPIRGNDTVVVRRIRFSSNHYDRADMKTNFSIAMGQGAVEVQIDKRSVAASFTKEVTVYITIEGAIACDNYAIIELVY